jgi:hypothetical protein
MPCRTLTRLWLFPRFQHTFGDIRLFAPVRHRTLWFSVACFGPWLLLMALLGVPWGNGWTPIRLVPPIVAVWWLNSSVDGGMRPDDVIRSVAGALVDLTRPRPRPVTVASRARIRR